MVDDEFPPDSPEEEPTVGYGKPPQHSRFRPGQSGNPKGRKKADPNFSRRIPTKKFLEIVAEEASTMIDVIEDGKRRRMPRQRAFVKALIQNAAKDPRLLQFYIRLLREAESQVPDKKLMEYDITLLTHEECDKLIELLTKATPKAPQW